MHKGQNSAVKSSQLSWAGQYKKWVQYDFKFTLEYSEIYVLDTVDWSKLEKVLCTYFVLSCTTKLTGLYRTVPTFMPASKMACRWIMS